MLKKLKENDTVQSIENGVGKAVKTVKDTASGLAGAVRSSGLTDAAGSAARAVGTSGVDALAIGGAGAGLLAAGAGAAVSGIAGGIGALISAGEYIKARKLMEKTMEEEPQLQQSEEYLAALEKVRTLEGQKPGDYESPYAGEITQMLAKIQERPEFSYDFAADPEYLRLRDEYVRQGRLAMTDTAANAASLSGGYGNSYAVTAGSQAFQSYLNELNSVIPELSDNAYSRWLGEGKDMEERLNLLRDMDSAEYARWEDSLQSYYKDLEFAYEQAQSAGDRDWQAYLTALDQWGFKVETYGGRMDTAFKNGMDSVGLAADSFSDFGSLAAGTALDTASLLEKQREQTAELAYKRERAEAEDAQWQAELDYDRERAAVKDSQWQAELDYDRERAAVSDAHWQAELDEKRRQFDQKQAAAKASAAKSSKKSSGKGTEEEDNENLLFEPVPGNKKDTFSDEEFNEFMLEMDDTLPAYRRDMIRNYYHSGRLTESQYRAILYRYDIKE